MPSTSAIMNRALRAHVLPVLRNADFMQMDARNAWRWQEKTIWVFNIRAVGNYFSSVTGWPPGSVGVWLGVYYPFFPREPHIKADKHGRLLPAEHMCHTRTHLDCTLDQSARVASLLNPAERRRTDIWWIDPQGESSVSASTNIAAALAEEGLPWLRDNSDLSRTLKEVEAERDCFTKFDTAALLAREIGDADKMRVYARLALAEGRRIKRIVDESRYDVCE